jgi:trehalose 6-phosphate synthase
LEVHVTAELLTRGESPGMREALGSGAIFVLSERGPFSFSLDRSGRLVQKTAGGGLASALGPLARQRPFCWFAATVSDGDRVAAQRTGGWAAGASRVHLVHVPRSVHALHYNAFANPLLWLIQHELADLITYPASPTEIERAWRLGYRPANVLLAEQVVSAARGSQPTILVQDYHLYLVPHLLRRQRPDALIAHFIHIPCPPPAAWTRLPWHIVVELLQGLLGADLVGFQSAADGDRFVATCRAYGFDVVGAGSDGGFPRVGTRTRVGHYPITVEAATLRSLASSPDAQEFARELACSDDLRTIVRVDRLDPSKNIPAGFDAFGRLLEREPDLWGQVRFLAQLVPSRSELREYREAAERSFAAAQRVNARFGTADWQPVEVFYEENRARAMALLSLYDVLLVNSLADGMNLVAKEGAVLNREGGALVLSRRAGAWEELQQWAIGVDPADVDETTDALGRALAMPPGQRWLRAAGLRHAVEQTSLDQWLDDQLDDLERSHRERLWVNGHRAETWAPLPPAHWSSRPESWRPLSKCWAGVGFRRSAMRRISSRWDPTRSTGWPSVNSRGSTVPCIVRVLPLWYNFAPIQGSPQAPVGIRGADDLATRTMRRPYRVVLLAAVLVPPAPRWLQSRVLAPRLRRPLPRPSRRGSRPARW